MWQWTSDVSPALRSGVPSEPSEEGCDGDETRGWEDKLGSGPSFLGKHNAHTQIDIYLKNYRCIVDLDIYTTTSYTVCVYFVRPVCYRSWSQSVGVSSFQRLFLLLKNHLLEFLFHQGTGHCTCQSITQTSIEKLKGRTHQHHKRRSKERPCQ